MSSDIHVQEVSRLNLSLVENEISFQDILTSCYDKIQSNETKIRAWKYIIPIEQQLPPKVAECLRLCKLDAITATSKNIARQTVALLGNDSRTQTWLSLSPSITSLLVDLGCERVITASEPSFDALVALKLA